MSTFFFRRSVEKAFQLDESPTGLTLSMSRSIDTNPPYIISAVDDVMYIVNTVIQKSLSTSQRDVVASVIPSVSRILGSDFIDMIQRRMRDESYPKPLVQGGFPPEDKIIAFIVLINSLDLANDYLARIITSRLGSAATDTLNGASTETEGEHLKSSFPFEHDVAFVTTQLHNLSVSFMAKSTELLDEGIKHLFNQVVKPRLHPVLSDTFRDADYGLLEDELKELAALQEEDGTGDLERLLETVPRRFEHGWDALVRPIARLMTPRTFAILLDKTAKYLARVLERRVLAFAGRTTPYGAVRLERDIGAVVAAVAARGSYAVREAFARVTQILVVANMEDEEWEELVAEEEAGGEGGMQWVLSDEDRRKARGLVRG
jgi:conserved oligomeric Golgi complex subunit 4